jgi:hypothetical protein
LVQIATTFQNLRFVIKFVYLLKIEIVAGCEVLNSIHGSHTHNSLQFFSLFFFGLSSLNLKDEQILVVRCGWTILRSASKEASKQTSRQASKQASKQASEQASKQASKRASKQVSK